MRAFTISSKVKAVLLALSAVAFWLLVWEITALIVDVRFIFPTVSDTVVSLLSGVISSDFWVSVSLSLVRILIGFALGVLLGVLLAVLCLLKPVYHLVQPLITVIRCTPVASFIMIFWLLVSNPYIPTLIALLMVLPVIWQSAYDAVSSLDRELTEVADIFEFSKSKRLLYLTAPTMVKAALPSVITASGLAWKAGVAAEIITYTKYSIGVEIAEAKNFLEGADLFAWTAVVVMLSLIVERVIKYFSVKAAKIWV